MQVMGTQIEFMLGGCAGEGITTGINLSEPDDEQGKTGADSGQTGQDEGITPGEGTKGLEGDDEIPQAAQDTLDYVRTHDGSAPPGHVSKVFHNYEGLLPKVDSDGNPITYREYDIKPYKKGEDRGPQRIVVGSDGKAYYTNDHYTSFVPIG